MFFSKRVDAKPDLVAFHRAWAELSTYSQQDLDGKVHALRAKPVLTESVAVACEAARRALGLELFDEQILGALALAQGCIVEMQTGEGKTLAAVPTVFWNALAGRVHVLTANEYLARRDAEWMGPAYRLLGLSVASISQNSTAAERRAAYTSDVLYGSPNEVGFDFLRDQLALDRSDLVQQSAASVIIDEVDSILLDEARIPLVIAGGESEAEPVAFRADRMARQLRHRLHFGCTRDVQLTDRGIAEIERSLACGNLYDPENFALYTAIIHALHAHHLLRRDVDYLVRTDRIELVDEFKGRVERERRWPAGLQTALEAKEGIRLQTQGRILGSITLQNLIRQYPKVGGMTGTAETQRQEFREVYGLEVKVIPTHRPMIRIDYADKVFPKRVSKERAVLEEIIAAHATGRPVLVGTASVDESERLSAMLATTGVPHHTLNARNDAEEAAIIAQAGELGAVTISTNMAGRGTDIKLGGEAVVRLGGLYVIGTNKHESRRIDNQLRGRAGRQGDPGSSRYFVSMEDDLMTRYELPETAGSDLDHVQRIIEGQNLEIRHTLAKYESVMEQHREAFTARRHAVLMDGGIDERRRRITLLKMDDLWSDYLASMAELRGGIHWISWTGKDPLHTFLTEAVDRYEEMEDLLETEIEEAVASVDPGDNLERGATWTYLINDQPFGTMSERLMQGIKKKLRASMGKR